jgi:hypothetical protein
MTCDQETAMGPGTAMIPTRDGLYATFDDGTHWQRIDSGAMSYSTIFLDGRFDDDGFIYLSSWGQGILKSTVPINQFNRPCNNNEPIWFVTSKTYSPINSELSAGYTVMNAECQAQAPANMQNLEWKAMFTAGDSSIPATPYTIQINNFMSAQIKNMTALNTKCQIGILDSNNQPIFDLTYAWYGGLDSNSLLVNCSNWMDSTRSANLIVFPFSINNKANFVLGGCTAGVGFPIICAAQIPEN